MRSNWTEMVTPLNRVDAGVDSLGNAIYEWTPGDPVDAIVSCGDPKGSNADERPDGKEVTYTVYLPTDGTNLLDVKRWMIRGAECMVVGEPEYWPASPTVFNSVVKVVRYEG